MSHPAPTTVSAATSWTSSSSSSSRWCPTPEQLMILEEMYRMGIHTPNAYQIQQITAQLSSYGKIEGKNVFYWFQNHKARDRQRLRRKFSKQLHLSHHYCHNHNHNHNQNQFCFQLPSSPQQQQHHQIYDHQYCFTQYVNEQSPSSHSPGFADSQHCACCSPSSFLQGGTMGSKHLMRGASPVEGDKTGTMRIHGLLDCMLTVDVSRSCIPYLPQPLKTLDLFPTTSTNLGEDCNPQQSNYPQM